VDNNTKYILEYWWKKIRKSEIPNMFDGFQDFSNWSVNNGYKYGRRLHRIDKGAEYSPDNMEWVDVNVNSQSNEIAKQKAIAKWDAFIKPIRERFLEDLELLEKIKKEEEEERIRKEKPAREFFRYEHPDLEREGIVWSGS
jgi:hypothetical protein